MERKYKTFNERKGIKIAHWPSKFLVSRSFLIKPIFLPEMKKNYEIEILKQENITRYKQSKFRGRYRGDRTLNETRVGVDRPE